MDLCTDQVARARSTPPRAGGVADTLVARLARSGYRRPLASVSAADGSMPLGPAADTVLLGEPEILDTVLRLTG